MADRKPNSRFPRRIKRVGFISTRIAGTDGVSLELEKWADTLESMGLECFYVAGELDRPEEKCFFIEEASFNHPKIKEITKRVFGAKYRLLQTTQMIHELVWVLKKKLYEMQLELALDLIIAENALTIPMNIPLGLALVEFLVENKIPCIAHHHDFYWERERFLVNAVDDYIRMAFPPALDHIQHVVINSVGSQHLSFRTGLASTVIPNVMDFDRPVPEMDDYASDFRQAIGLSDDDWFILQPTRVVPRKGIEHAVELVKRLDSSRAKLVISHSAGDEGYEYFNRVVNYAELLGVNVIFAGEIVGDRRDLLDDGRKVYTIEDIYPHADFVTYPSTYEGFGNAFLEAIYFRKPLVCNRYSIYRTDIEPRGFDVIAMDGFVTEEVVRETVRVLEDPARRESMVEKNFKLADRFFSYRVLEQRLRGILTSFQGADEEIERPFVDLPMTEFPASDVY